MPYPHPLLPLGLSFVVISLPFSRLKAGNRERPVTTPFQVLRRTSFRRGAQPFGIVVVLLQQGGAGRSEVDLERRLGYPVRDDVAVIVTEE